MTELKINKTQVPGLEVRLLSTIQRARTKHSSPSMGEKLERAWLARLRVFEVGVRTLISLYAVKQHTFVLHYEGSSLEQASYVELQLCSSFNTDEIVGLFAAQLEP